MLRSLGLLGVDKAVLGRLGEPEAPGVAAASRSSSASSSLSRATTSAGTFPRCRCAKKQGHQLMYDGLNHHTLQSPQRGVTLVYRLRALSSLLTSQALD